MSAAQAAMAAKIAALRAKTRSAGCTEAEAVAAAELAAKLMAAHGLSEEDLVITEAAARETTTRATWRTKLSGAIAHCTNTAGIHCAAGASGTFVFVGTAPGPEIACYLRDVCFRAVEASLRVFKGSTFYRRRRSDRTRRAAAADFVHALVHRLCLRLLAAFGPTVNAAARQVAIDARDRRYSNGKAVTLPQREERFAEASYQGRKAADGVPLNRGVGEDEAKRLRLISP